MTPIKEKIDITVIIITHNEEKNLERCIGSIRGFVKDIFVLDSNSTDGTKKILQKNKIRFEIKKFKNYSNQFNSAIKLSKAKTTWLMRLDADEYVEKKFFINLKKKINKISLDINGIYINRRYIFFGKEIRFGGTFPHKSLRIWRRNKGKCNNNLMDEKIITKPKQVYINIDIFEHNKDSFLKWKKKHIKYAYYESKNYFKNINYKKNSKDKIANKSYFKKFEIYYRFPIFIRPVLLFLYNYFLKLSFLDGYVGLKYCFWQTLWFRMLVDINIFKYKKINNVKYY